MKTALVAVALATFAGVWSFGFVNFDDPQYVINNPHDRAVGARAPSPEASDLGR